MFVCFVLKVLWEELIWDKDQDIFRQANFVEFCQGVSNGLAAAHSLIAIRVQWSYLYCNYIIINTQVLLDIISYFNN